MEKKPFGLGITKGLGRNYLIRTQVDEDFITIATYETFFHIEEEHKNVYKSLCMAKLHWANEMNFAEKLPALVHDIQPLPTHYSDEDFIPGELFEKSSDFAFQLRSKVTLNKTFNVLGIDAKNLWSEHSDINILMEENGSINIPHNKFVYTKLGKIDGAGYVLLKNVCGIGQLHVSHPTGSFENDGLRISVNEEIGYVSNKEFDVEVSKYGTDYSDFMNLWYNTLYSADTTICPSDGMVEIPVTISGPDGAIFDENNGLFLYAKCDAGYLPRTQIELVDGGAKIRFMALGLEVGEKATVKIGFKNYDNATSTEITVV